MWKVWLIISGIFFVIEMFTVGFLFFWFSVSALITLVVSLFIDSVAIQITVFIVSSAILLFATKPFVSKFIKNDSSNARLFSIEGKKGIVTKDIDSDHSVGLIKVNGETWSAKSSDGSYISQNTEVIVEKIDGVKAIVKPI